MRALYLDFCQTEDVIPSCTSINLSLQHASDAFRLMCPAEQQDQFKLVIEKCELIVTQMRLRDDIMKNIETKMSEDHRLTYHINRILCTGPHQVLRGTTIFTKQISRGRKPMGVLAFLTRSAGSEG